MFDRIFIFLSLLCLEFWFHRYVFGDTTCGSGDDVDDIMEIFVSKVPVVNVVFKIALPHGLGGSVHAEESSEN